MSVSRQFRNIGNLNRAARARRGANLPQLVAREARPSNNNNQQAALSLSSAAANNREGRFDVSAARYHAFAFVFFFLLFFFFFIFFFFYLNFSVFVPFFVFIFCYFPSRNIERGSI